MPVIWAFSSKTWSFLSISKKEQMEPLLLHGSLSLKKYFKICMSPSKKTPSHAPEVSRIYAAWLLFWIESDELSQEKLILSMKLCKVEEL